MKPLYTLTILRGWREAEEYYKKYPEEKTFEAYTFIINQRLYNLGAFRCADRIKYGTQRMYNSVIKSYKEGLRSNSEILIGGKRVALIVDKSRSTKNILRKLYE